MKLKAVLLAGAICLAGALTSSAQTVYSANTVGFVNRDIPTGFSMIANPVIAANNTIAGLFPEATLGWALYKFDRSGGTFSIFSVGFGGWDAAAQTETLVPGEGAFIFNPGAPTMVTFSGEVATGPASNITIGAGFSILSSVVAQGGLLQSELGFPAALGDQVFKFNAMTKEYELSSVGFGGWDSEPTVDVGDAFFVNKTSQVDWDRDFDPNAAP